MIAEVAPRREADDEVQQHADQGEEFADARTRCGSEIQAVMARPVKIPHTAACRQSDVSPGISAISARMAPAYSPGSTAS